MKRNKEIFDMRFCTFEQNLELWLSDLKKKWKGRKRWNRAGIRENRISGYIPGFYFLHREAHMSTNTSTEWKKERKKICSPCSELGKCCWLQKSPLLKGNIIIRVINILIISSNILKCRPGESLPEQSSALPLMAHFLNGFAGSEFTSLCCSSLPPTRVNIALKNTDSHCSSTAAPPPEEEEKENETTKKETCGPQTLGSTFKTETGGRRSSGLL